MSIEVTLTNPKSYSVPKDLGCPVILPLSHADQEKEKRNPRYKKGIKRGKGN